MIWMNMQKHDVHEEYADIQLILCDRVLVLICPVDLPWKWDQSGRLANLRNA